MKMLPICLLIVFMKVSVEGVVLPVSPVVNQYFDTVLNTLRFNREIHSEAGLEEVDLPPFPADFSQVVKPVGEVKGQAYFADGQMSKLTEPRRLTNCPPPYYSARGRTFRCELAFDNVKADYATCNVSYGNMPQVTFKTEARMPRALFTVEVVENSPGKPIVRSVEVTNPDKMYVKFTGLGPLALFTKKMDEGFRTGMKGDPFQHVQGTLRNAFDHAVGWVPFPAA